MDMINAALTAFAGILFAPFRGASPLIPLLITAVVTGVFMAWVFRHTSNQRALRRAAERARAELFALKLFREGFVVTLSAQGRLLRATGARLLYSLPPVLVLFLPLVLLLIQLGLRYEHAPLLTGDSAVVELRLRPDSWSEYRNATLIVPAHVVVETAPLRDEERRTIYWRIRPRSAEPVSLRWDLGGEPLEKRLAVAAEHRPLLVVDPRRPGSGRLDRIVHPSEPGVPTGSPAQAVVVHYPRRRTPVLGLDVPWWATFTIVAMLAALASKPWLKVTF